jgi:MFS superfamily sulfate permease-like transporter
LPGDTYLAVALSIAAMLQRMSNPTIAALGRLGESRNFVDVNSMPEAKTDPRILVLRPSQPLFFGNAEATLSRIASLATSRGAKVVIVSLEDSDSLDSTALDALLECEQKLARGGCTLVVARVKQDILDTLGRSGTRGLSLQSRCYFSVADAFDRARALTAA